jgi:hydroxymethylglutaryl-CoA synthase
MIGALSQVCYFQALEDVYSRFCDKMDRSSTGSATFDAETPDYFVFHAPYNKLVQKSFARLCFLDARRRNSEEEEKKDEHHIGEEWLTKPLEDTYADKSLEGVLKNLSADAYNRKLKDSNYVSTLVGNTYTASVFLGLASLIDRAGGRGDLTPGKSIVMFSYGSGAMATIYRLTV